MQAESTYSLRKNPRQKHYCIEHAFDLKKKKNLKMVKKNAKIIIPQQQQKYLNIYTLNNQLILKRGNEKMNGLIPQQQKYYLNIYYSNNQLIVKRAYSNNQLIFNNAIKKTNNLITQQQQCSNVYILNNRLTIDNQLMIKRGNEKMNDSFYEQETDDESNN